jgi:hypothetical protein
MFSRHPDMKTDISTLTVALRDVERRSPRVFPHRHVYMGAVGIRAAAAPAVRPHVMQRGNRLRQSAENRDTRTGTRLCHYDQILSNSSANVCHHFLFSKKSHKKVQRMFLISIFA